MSDSLQENKIRRGYILIRETFEREGEIYAEQSIYEQEDMFLYPRLKECFLYEYNGSSCQVYEVDVIDPIERDTDSQKDRYYTNRVRIMHRIPRETLINDMNIGHSCNGYCNSGDDNIGDKNSGYGNMGDKNSGSFNIGNMNSGSFNSGDCNVGEGNVGYFNSGERNSGSHNVGCYNSGNFNVGDFNCGGYNSGAFCTGETPFMLFNQPSPISRDEWFTSAAREILMMMPKKSTKWNNDLGLTEKEYQSAPILGGDEQLIGPTVEAYDRVIRQNWWDKLPEDKKDTVKEIPGFDPEIFEECTGIHIK